MSVSFFKERYRYVCTKCGSSRLVKRASSHHPQATNDHVNCRTCKTSLDTVYDKKKGVEVNPL